VSSGYFVGKLRLLFLLANFNFWGILEMFTSPVNISGAGGEDLRPWGRWCGRHCPFFISSKFLLMNRATLAVGGDAVNFLYGCGDEPIDYVQSMTLKE
jgi:hypothetical protein